MARRILDAAKRVKEKPKEIVLAIGEVASVNSNEIKNALKQLTRASIKTKNIAAIVRCNCGYEGRPKILQRLHDFVAYACPRCGSTPKLIQGDAVLLIDVK